MLLRVHCSWLLIAWCGFVLGWAAPVHAAEAKLSCRAYVLYDCTSNSIVRESNPRRSQPIASLTKLMTAILVAEQLRFDGRYILLEPERKALKTKTIRAQQLLELMLVPSSNSACRVAARIVAGNEPRFTKLMNQRAQELGLQDTYFANSTGLPAEGQRSTPADVLSLFLYTLRYPAICAALGLHKAEVNGHGYEGTLLPLYQRHPGLLGGKTGYTKAAGRCLVLYYRVTERGSAQRDYILVILGSKGVKQGFADAELLLHQFGLSKLGAASWQ